MTSFCIASPHKNVLWYDYRLYVNLRHELEALGYQYKAACQNRIYFLGAPQRQFYNEVGRFDPKANNIALVYCHSEKLDSINQFRKVYVCSEGVRSLLNWRSLKRFDFLKRDKLFTGQDSIDIIRPFSSLTPVRKTKPKYQCDISFMGTPRIRPILEEVLPIAEANSLKLNLYGPNWDQYPGNSLAKKYWVATTVPYEEIPLLANGSKICLIDHHESMNQIGSVSHKYIDFIMSGGFVISDHNKDAWNFYKGLCFSEKQPLAQLIKTYLTDEPKRQKHKLKQQAIAIGQSTRAAAIELAKNFI